ncbi:trehalose 6-phosphatase [Rhodoblastus acidophilus]|uniref:Trehalose 6-phosphate phosphatase n=1 Tax=Rhodoblastus acidophilus TaxID=1074 RepID=A0A212RER5_RHOAC|nr:trehalose-phosphatase [Rhodoblastus acidophilus]PPQ39704.1 trehalose-phosphatase [Rhodoblastus acidophilus]RAI24486.1 trehalose-phosphatase [Rhodoblastus acidophilus]SNB70845.1 trehalose 6-phosphatase [Rhodoblastus acidophilus]
MEDARRVWNAALREPEAIALFLDFDGTLVEIAETPEAAKSPPALPSLLARLSRGLSGALALVSGRPIADLDRRLAPFRCAAAGVHGAEFRLDAGSAIAMRAAPLDARVRGDVAKLAGDDPRLLVEDKGGAIAVHYRLAEHLGPELERRLEDYIRASDGDLMVQPGRKVFEVLGGAVSKGDAVRRFMSQPPFAGRRPLMIGDDRTDVSAFEVCAALGGAGLRVAGEFFASDAADFASPAEVRQWLGAQAELFFAPEIR